jgi:hypothetical protein
MAIFFTLPPKASSAFREIRSVEMRNPLERLRAVGASGATGQIKPKRFGGDQRLWETYSPRALDD